MEKTNFNAVQKATSKQYKNPFTTPKRIGTALITGASSGIGEEFAWQLASAGHNLVLVARTQEKLQELAQQIHNKLGVNVQVLTADLSKDQDLKLVQERIKDKAQPPIDLLINNAGFAVAQPFVGADIDKELYALKVLVQAPLQLTHTAIEVMRKRNRSKCNGAIINVASIAAFSAMGTYASAKSWLATFTKSLATEVTDEKILVTAVCPGLVRTNFHNAPNIKDARWPKFAWCTSQEVVSASLKALNAGKVVVVPTLKYKICYAAMKFAPEFMIRKFAGHSASSNAQF